MAAKSMERFSIEQWDSLISSIYQSALRPERWNEALLAIGQPINAHAGHLIVLPEKNSSGYFEILPGLDPCALEEHPQYVLNGLNPRVVKGLTLPSMSFMHDYMHITETEIKRNLFYQEFAKKHECDYYAGFILQNEQGCMAAVAILRSKRFGHLTELEIELMKRFMPHLRRSVDLMRLLPYQGLLIGLSESLENHPAGAVVIDYRGEIVSMNVKAQAILARKDGLHELNKRLHSESSCTQKQLDSEISQLISATDYLGMTGDGYIPVPRTQAVSPYVLFVTPIRNPEDPFRRIAGVILALSSNKCNLTMQPVNLLAAP
jgi:hypothetical protein